MYLISAEGYTNAGVCLLRVKRKTREIWVSTENAEDGLGVQNISDLVLKEISVFIRLKNNKLIKFKNRKHICK